MNSRSRYTLIGIGFLVFGILAPTIVFYVRGVKFDTAAKKQVATGLITVETDPRGADLILNGIKKGTTPQDIRFLTPGEYEITIKKDGYQDWSKRLPVFPSKVTWAMGGVSEIFLFKKESKTTKIDTGVSAFTRVGNALFYTTASALIKGSGNDFAEKDYTTLTPGTYTITPSHNTEFLLLQNGKSGYIFNTNKNQLSIINKQLANSLSTTVLDDGSLITLEGTSLFSWTSGYTQKNLIMGNVKNYTVSGINLYVISTQTNGSSLHYINTDENLNPQKLFENLPSFEAPTLIATPEKTLYILDKGTLSRISTKLEPVAIGVLTAHGSFNGSHIIFTTAGELNSYDSTSARVQLIDRSVKEYTNSVLRTDIGYAFTISGGEIKAIELDSRDRPNTYSFGKPTNPQSFLVEDDASRLFILDNGVLSFEEIH